MAVSNPAQVTAKATILQYNYISGIAADFTSIARIHAVFEDC
jgi:hypothetical protein